LITAPCDLFFSGALEIFLLTTVTISDWLCCQCHQPVI